METIKLSKESKYLLVIPKGYNRDQVQAHRDRFLKWLKQPPGAVLAIPEDVRIVKVVLGGDDDA